MLVFDQERMNELRLYQAGGSAAEAGFKTILTGAAHPPYGEFVPAPGHGLGFNDQKVVEVRHLLAGIAGDAPDPSRLRRRARNRADHLRDRRIRPERQEGSASADVAAAVNGPVSWAV